MADLEFLNPPWITKVTSAIADDASNWNDDEESVGKKLVAPKVMANKYGFTRIKTLLITVSMILMSEPWAL